MVACEALGMMGIWGRNQASQVSGLLEDSRVQVRGRAATACAKMGDRSSISKLSDMLADASPVVREEVVRALPLFSDDSQEYIEKLSERLVDPAPSVRIAVIEVLASMGDRGCYYASAV